MIKIGAIPWPTIHNLVLVKYCSSGEDVLAIPNGCFDAYEVKVNKDISKYQEK